MNKVLKTKANETTPGELRILKAISKFATNVENRFNGVEGRLTSVEGRLVNVEERVKKEADRLDRKIENARGDIVKLLRDEDKKVRHVAGILNEKEIFDDADLRRVYEMEPFPEPALSKKK